MTNSHKKPAAKAKDDAVLCRRPKGVLTGEERKRRKSEGTIRRTTREFLVLNQYQRAQAIAQAYDRDGNVKKTQVKDWVPKPLEDGTYGSSAMQELAEEFGALAADLVQDFTGGK